jgi:hypothetical protein
MPSNQMQALLNCNCGCEPYACNPCPPGTIYPWLVSISFPSLGVSELAGNELDPEEDGETTFVYRVEGSYGGYSFQCLFGECEASISIIRNSDGASICVGGGASGEEGAAVNMNAVSCPPEPLVLVYTITCSNGTTIEVVIEG